MGEMGKERKTERQYTEREWRGLVGDERGMMRRRLGDIRREKGSEISSALTISEFGKM